MNERFSLHKVVEQGKFPFSPEAYSKFKFGCKDTARDFGIALADAFAWEYIIPKKLTKQIVVTSSPYCFIPTATFAMKDYFVQRLNQYLVQAELPVVEETKIHRTVTYKEDYGELSAEERFALIQNDGFHMDTTFIKDKHIIFLDDIRITGSHERVINRMLGELNIEEHCIFTYFAELTNMDIDPKVENYLNYYFVKSLLDLDKIIKNDNFLFNTRVVKYMLNSPHEEFKTFINYQRVKFLETFYYLAIGNSYHLMDDYKENLNYLKKLLND